MPVNLKDALDDICRRYGLTELYAFGSRATEIADRVWRTPGEPAAGGSASDVDVGVRPLVGVRLDVDAVVGLADELEQLFEAPRVCGELLYCADSHAQAEYELYVLATAGDLAWIRDHPERIERSP